MDDAQIGNDCIIAPGAVVPPGMIVPDGHMVRGVPAKIIRMLREEEIIYIQSLATRYVELSMRYSDGLNPRISP
jgi:carbonic anhydrase/acetyltransferase-like protein (isoleucine patch superfamily)